MKVLYLLNTTALGGGNISFINMIKGLHKKGIKIYIAHPDKKIDKKFQKMVIPYVEGIYYVPLKMYFHPQSQFEFINILNKLKNSFFYQKYKHYEEDKFLSKLVNSLKPDLIHTNVGVIQAGYRVSKKLKIPHVWHLREYQIKDFHWKIEPSKKKFSQLVNEGYSITITKDIHEYFKLGSKSKIIYNGAFSKKDTFFNNDKGNYFLCASRVSEEKGFDDIIRAFIEFHKNYPNYKLKIAGFGEEKYIKKLKKILTTENCVDAVEFLGFRNDVRKLMDNAKALIVASRFEGFGRMTAEAAFRGCLVIGRNTGGTKEILQEINGLPYQGSWEELEKKMKEVVDLSNEEYEKKALFSQDKAKEKYSIEQNVDNVYKFYQDILKKEEKKKNESL